MTAVLQRSWRSHEHVCAQHCGFFVCSLCSMFFHCKLNKTPLLNLQNSTASLVKPAAHNLFSDNEEDDIFISVKATPPVIHFYGFRQKLKTVCLFYEWHCNNILNICFYFYIEGCKETKQTS